MFSIFLETQLNTWVLTRTLIWVRKTSSVSVLSASGVFSPSVLQQLLYARLLGVLPSSAQSLTRLRTRKRFLDPAVQPPPLCCSILPIPATHAAWNSDFHLLTLAGLPHLPGVHLSVTRLRNCSQAESQRECGSTSCVSLLLDSQSYTACFPLAENSHFLYFVQFYSCLWRVVTPVLVTFS